MNRNTTFNDGDDPVPTACTLSAKSAVAQLDEWSRIRRSATSSRAIRSGARMTFPAELRSIVVDLARREQECCSFLDLSTRIAGAECVLEITSTVPDGVAVATILAGVDADELG